MKELISYLNFTNFSIIENTITKEECLKYHFNPIIQANNIVVYYFMINIIFLLFISLFYLYYKFDNRDKILKYLLIFYLVFQAIYYLILFI